eukprot:3164511-Rhodomonas_salina.2
MSGTDLAYGATRSGICSRCSTTLSQSSSLLEGGRPIGVMPEQVPISGDGDMRWEVLGSV